MRQRRAPRDRGLIRAGTIAANPAVGPAGTAGMHGLPQKSPARGPRAPRRQAESCRVDLVAVRERPAPPSCSQSTSGAAM